MHFHGTRRWIMIRRQRHLIFIRFLQTTVCPRVVLCLAKRFILGWIVVSKYIYIEGWMICKLYWSSYKKKNQKKGKGGFFWGELDVWFLQRSLDVGMLFVLPVISINSMQCSGKLEGRQPPVLTLQHHSSCHILGQWIGRGKEGDEMNCNKICHFPLSKVPSPSTTMEWEWKGWLWRGN